MSAVWEKLDPGLIVMAFLATIGTYMVFELLAVRFFGRAAPRRKPEIVLLVKDMEEKIEGIIRSLARRGVFENSEAVVVVDEGSMDGTLEILERLSAEFGFDIEENCRLDFQKSPFTVVMNCSRLTPGEIEVYLDRLTSTKKVEMGLKSHKN
ncbi:hypothetical protein [Thermosediminibacter litoriperuensis]|uniref:Glycosyl transferase family 2 n=1 Tax=Thermosediminibacter litoriperuensis TaxID=291989 RepID=A0A5S5AGG3_9FIRM|nr:hypothetical protein [Thermosediminibacter litoriperuensis]TYP49279.1 hypothetical protein LZ11_02166 [Thermosediminibacter litoriperuensis]